MAGQKAIQALGEVKWDGRKPTQAAIVELFIGSTTWHSSWVKTFKPILKGHDNMKNWLLGNDDAEDDEEVWGFKKDKYTMADLQEWCKNGGQLKAKSPEKKKKKKASGLSK